MSSYNGKRFTFCGIREGVQKKEFFLGRSFPNVFTHPPTQGFLRDLGKRKLKFGSKKAIFAVILRGLGLVWESATLPTHIWERSPKKNGLFWTPPLMLIIHSIIAFISGAGCPGSGSAGVFMFWKFPEFVKCARRSRAHLTDSGNFQNIHIPVQ